MAKKAESRIASALRALRLAADQSLANFGDDLGVARAVIYRWEAGLMEPRPNTLYVFFDWALDANLPHLAVAFMRPIAEDTGMPLFGIILAGLIGLEENPTTDPRRIAKLSKRALELLEAG